MNAHSPLAHLREVGAAAVEEALSSPAPKPATTQITEKIDSAAATADAIANDVLAFLARQIGHRASVERAVSAPTTGGALVAQAHAVDALADKLRRIASMAAELRKL